jgi:hypothetical protein
MNTDLHTGTHTTHRRGWGALARYYLEMTVAMSAAMAVLGTTRAWLGWNVASAERPTVAYLLMAIDMSVGMVAVMRWRRHSWAHTAEMCAVMFVPLPLFPTVAAFTGSGAGHGAMAAAHVVMFAAMLALMIWRRDIYAAHHSAVPTRPRHRGPSQEVR